MFHFSKLGFPTWRSAEIGSVQRLRHEVFATQAGPGRLRFAAWGLWGRLQLEADCMHSVEIGIGLLAVVATRIDM